MQNSMRNTARSETSGSSKPIRQLPWTLRRLNRTYFLTEDEQAVRIEHPIEEGATDEQWRSLLRSTGIAVRNDNKSWGPQHRRDFLNWLETEHPDRMPRLFDSKEAAFEWLAQSKKSSSNEDENEDPPDGAA